MQKLDVLASMDQYSLLMPAWIQAALAANDRLKLYLTLLQAAREQATRPDQPAIDLSRELADAGACESWLPAVPGNSYMEHDQLDVPDLPALTTLLRRDLDTMSRPLTVDSPAHNPALSERVSQWCHYLERLDDERLSDEALAALTSGNRERSDSLHLLVMDLHKALNQLAAGMSDETVDGAHVWQLYDDDRRLVAAFMRGLNRTRAVKFDHPGLDTAATRDGERLLIQNDIGTNDAHVLVIQVEHQCIRVTYSDLHRKRFSFFQRRLKDIGYQWSNRGLRSTPGLNTGEAYHVGTATFEATEAEELEHALTDTGSQIVFLIDWNRARKRLERIVAPRVAWEVLNKAADGEFGHMGWLRAGGAGLIHSAMEEAGSDDFHLGDRLDTVIEAATARNFLLEVMELAARRQHEGASSAMIADEVELALSRYLRQRRDAFDLLSEHAYFCHALAEGLRDALAHDYHRDPQACSQLAKRARAWEHGADECVTKSRQRAERHERWQTLCDLIEQADDVADELEEAVFLLSLIAEGHCRGWDGTVLEQLRNLAAQVLDAVQDHVRAVTIARELDEMSPAEDHESFLAALWNVLQAEKQCDELLRTVRRTLVTMVNDAATLSLSVDFAAALERATDYLLATGYALRKLALQRSGASR